MDSRKCLCGCGRKLRHGKQKYYMTSCFYIHKKTMLFNGCVPLEKIGFGVCKICGDEFIYSLTDKRATCKQFSGKPCDRRLSAKKKLGKTLNKLDKDRSERLHIQTLCHPDNGQSCKRYAEGFSIDNPEAGCWGRVHYRKDGSCYEPEPYSPNCVNIDFSREDIVPLWIP